MPKPRHRVGWTKENAASPTFGALPVTVLSDPAPLIGRERELETIRTHLLGESVRLVTLTGPGGIGKTRLALAAARYVQPAFRDGVWFVDLAPLHDPAEIDAAIGQALRLEETAAAPSPAERVNAYLRDRHLLLVLDNFEHLLPAAVRVAVLLAAAPQLKVLVTSREPLNLRLEHRLLVTGLALPDLRTPAPAWMMQAPAAMLFMEHARRVQPDLALTLADAPALAALLHRLDGLPLAIRIVAARSHVLSPTAMLARLQGQALLSTEEVRDVPGRQHTLRDAMDWSYGLLSATEQTAFRQLAVFVGGWTLEAAEAVIQAEPGMSTWAILGLLVDKSLVQADAIAGDDRRYRLLQPVREYALARLVESGELGTARDRHAHHYLALTEQAAAAGWGRGEEAWFRRLETEHENIRAALRWAGERRDSELSLRLTAALADFYFWAVRGYLREGRRWLEEARALGADTAPSLRARALVGEGFLALLMGDYSQARALLEEALALAEPLRDPALMVRILTRLGTVTAFQDDPSDARALLERGVALGREAGTPETVIALVMLGRTFVLLEDLERAETTVTEALDLARTVGSTHLTAYALTNLAQLRLRHRDYTGAAGLAAEALRLARLVEFGWSINYLVVIAAEIRGHHGDLERAARLLAAVDSWSEWTGEMVLPMYDPAAYTALQARVRQQTGKAAYQAAVAEARAMSVDQVADLAQACLELFAPHRSDDTAAVAAPPPRLLLSDRERAILRLVSEGLQNKQIATALSIGERTVKTHLASAMNKLGVDNRAHAAVAAVQRGLL